MVPKYLRKSQSPGLRLVVTLVHLSLGAYLGVATRGFLAKLFTLGCNSGQLCFEGARKLICRRRRRRSPPPPPPTWCLPAPFSLGAGTFLTRHASDAPN